MTKSQLFKYDDFVSANSERRVSSFDYLHAIYKMAELPTDFVSRFARLFWPDFVVVEDKIFVSELFDKADFQNLLQSGQSKSSVQFWTNLLEITGLFDGLSIAQALDLAESISQCWNGKLISEFGDKAESARVIHDKEKDEIFVVIGHPD